MTNQVNRGFIKWIILDFVEKLETGLITNFDCSRCNLNSLASKIEFEISF
jgi:hypothetical protein